MKIDYEKEASIIIMLSAVKFVHLWETNSGCNKEGRWKHLCGNIDYRQCIVVGFNRQCTESLAKHSFVVCTSSSTQLDVV